MKKALIVLVVVLIAGGAFVFFKEHANAPQEVVSDTPTESPVPSAAPSGPNITLTSPKSGDTVTSPITITGTARVFENQFSYDLKDSTGKKLIEGTVMSDAKDSGQFGNYTIKVAVPAGATKKLTVEVFNHSAKDGSIVDLASASVNLSVTTTATTKVFFGNATNQCEKVVAVTHNITKTSEPAFTSLFELLKGPSAADKTAKYTSAIPDGVHINSLAVASGIASVDFDNTLGAGVAGACRVAAIRAQITQTLKQFTSIKNVVILINGKSDAILQP